jgi:exodeoxyribonuclease VII large subunit
MRDSAGGPAEGVQGDVYTVTEISDAVRQHLESEFSRVSVIGEIANYKVHTSGHVYFTLRDSTTMLHAVLFRRQAACLEFAPAGGMLVIASGRISHFGGSGRTQIIATGLIPAGRGGMEIEFRRLLERLSGEGLTAPQRKRPIPPYPARIAVITSPTGAVIRDIIDTLGRRWPVARVTHVHAEVQGPGAPRSIAAAFAAVNAMEDVDVVILARGGGSAEDLWTFNLEEVARAVSGSTHPVITGVGHEIDTTIVDYVSDLRAATPTAAAELATPLVDEVERTLEELLGRMARVGCASIENRRHLIEYLLRSAAFPAVSHAVERAELEIDDAADALASWWVERRRLLDEALDASARGMERSLRDAVSALGRGTDLLAGRLSAGNPAERIRHSHESLRHLSRGVRAGASGAVFLRRRELSGALAALAALDPRGVLRRGYTVCTTAGDERVVPRVASLAADDDLMVHFYDGGALCRVREKRKGSRWHGKRASRTPSGV